MISSDFGDIEQTINNYGWFSFGQKEFECPGVMENYIKEYLRTEKLPSPCNECYKALVFWEGNYSEDNLTNFFKSINSFEINYRGKLNRKVVILYFKNKEKMLEFLNYLGSKMQKYDVKGKTQWRRACKEYQNLKPELWKNAKEFINDL